PPPFRDRFDRQKQKRQHWNRQEIPRITSHLKMPFEQRRGDCKYDGGQKSCALLIQRQAHFIKQKKADQGKRDNAPFQLNDADTEEGKRNRGQISFPPCTRVVWLTVHVEWKIASLQNVFAHQTDDRLVAMDMGLRRR